MQHKKSSISRSKRQQGKQDERGIALITTLLLLMLLSGLTLAMAWSARSDMLINGYYRNFRGSFYAADSGLNIMRQALNDEFVAGSAVYPASFKTGVNPLPSGSDATIQADVKANYGSKNLTSSSSGIAAKSWPENYNADITLKQTRCTATNPAGTVTDCTAPKAFAADATSADYVYSYKITSTGQSRGTESTVLTDDGVLQVHASLGNPPIMNFAGYGMFIDSQKECASGGGTLVPGTITGPVFTNGGWTFGTGTYKFTDLVQQVDQNAGFSNSGCDALDAAADAAKGIAPTFLNGFKRGATAVKLPPNSFQQAQAVLDGIGADDSTLPTPSDMKKVLRDAKKLVYPDSPAPTTGVFLPYNLDSSNNATFTGGGIMVKGDAGVVLTPIGATGQQYTITQGTGSSLVTTTILIDNTANTTVMTSVKASGGTSTVNISGVPVQNAPGTGTSMGPATMLYVDGNITQLTGPGPGLPAIQDKTKLTITAANNTDPTVAENITVTGDLLYKQEPVDSLDNLVAAGDKGQALGIFTPKGDIQLKNSQSSGNLEIDGSMATISDTGTGGIINTGSAITTLTIVGGRIQNQIKNINATTRNVLFDKRFANGFSPPWFPSTGVTPASLGQGLTQPVLTRLQWLNTNATY